MAVRANIFSSFFFKIIIVIMTFPSLVSPVKSATVRRGYGEKRSSPYTKEFSGNNHSNRVLVKSNKKENNNNN